MSRITRDIEHIDHGAENDDPEYSHPAHGRHDDGWVDEGDAEAIEDKSRNTRLTQFISSSEGAVAGRELRIAFSNPAYCSFQELAGKGKKSRQGSLLLDG
jgi:hypothetical protein